MLIAFIFFFLLFVALIVLTSMEKLTRFITGGDNDDGAYDGKAITRFLMVMLSVLAIAALLGVVGYIVESLYMLMFVSPVVFMGVLVFALIYVNTGNRFRTDKDSHKK